MTSPQHPPHLHDICLDWDRASTDLRSRPNFLAFLRHIETHARLRFSEYEPFHNSNKPFLDRLRRWITQVDDTREQQTLFEFVRWLMYVDRREMQALYQDVFRRIIVPWISADLTIDDQLAPDYDRRVLDLLQHYDLYSITASFNHKLFENLNGLSGLRKPVVLGEALKHISGKVSKSGKAAGIIVLEDVVGSGSQAARVLRKVRQSLSTDVPVLFTPLLALEHGCVSRSALGRLKGITVRPTCLIPSSFCLTEDPHDDEPRIYKRMRSVVRGTQERVLSALDERDDPPDDPFGFGGAGAVLVTSQNTPNNTLALIHHKSPEWEPLFRRLHHSYRRPQK